MKIGHDSTVMKWPNHLVPVDEGRGMAATRASGPMQKRRAARTFPNFTITMMSPSATRRRKATRLS